MLDAHVQDGHSFKRKLKGVLQPADRGSSRQRQKKSVTG